jgi:hypothetical protein
MTLSLHVIRSGEGVEYLLKSVAAGGGNRSVSTPLTRHYREKGTQPGAWIGAGLSGPTVKGKPPITTGDEVTERQLGLLLGGGLHPLSGRALGKTMPVCNSVDERDEERVLATTNAAAMEVQARRCSIKCRLVRP